MGEPGIKRVKLSNGNSQHGCGVHGEAVMDPALKAPFPYIGGKSRIAEMVWDRLGDVENYVEPFCGSAAILLGRPTPPRIETINDADCFVANFWRATAADPEAVAAACDWPVNEADLHARHRWMVLSPASAQFRERMRTDPDYYDVRIAAWWCWGACCWIGSGWCSDAELRNDGNPREKTPLSASGLTGVSSSSPDLHAKRPRLGGRKNDSGKRSHEGTGVHSQAKPSSANWEQIPHIVHTGRGVLSAGMDGHRPQLADAFARGRGVHGNDDAGTCEQRRAWLVSWFSDLRDRLRVVRVCCGHWKRVCSSHSVTTRLGLTGVFLDPPYPTHDKDGKKSRASALYGQDGSRADLDNLRDEVLAWCMKHGDDPLMRIAVCGYDTDGYAALEALGWSVESWKAVGGYGNRGGDNPNASRERVWFSPHVLNPENERQPLFMGLNDDPDVFAGAKTQGDES